jgi:hypothetical protein
MIASIGAIMLLGSVYGIKSVSAAENTPTVQTKVVSQSNLHIGKRLLQTGKFKDQIQEVKTLRAERVDLKKQIVGKKKQLHELFTAAKQSKQKDVLKQAKDVKHQLKVIKKDRKGLLKDARTERRALKMDLKNDNGNTKEEFNKFIATQKQVNAKMKEEITQLNKIIDILN